MVRRVISQETKAKAYPGALKKTKIETAFRGQDKRVKITVYTILPYFCVLLFNKSGENSNVNKRKTQSRIQRTLTRDTSPRDLCIKTFALIGLPYLGEGI